MHQPTNSEIQGELLALRCYVAALFQVLPLSSQRLLPAAFERCADLVCDQLDESGAAGFDRAATALAVRRREVFPLASELGRGQQP